MWGDGKGQEGIVAGVREECFCVGGRRDLGQVLARARDVFVSAGERHLVIYI